MNSPDWVETRDYQIEAIRAWTTAEGKGILKMATGTGKTVTALLLAEHVKSTLGGRLALIVAVPYQHLVDQWSTDIREFGLHPIKAYYSRSNWKEDFDREVLEFNMGVREVMVVVTTHATFTSEVFQETLQRVDQDEQLLIADEVHHLGSPTSLSALPGSVKLRLGLSATPERWYDDRGTDRLFDYFGGVVFDYSLKDAIDNGNLCEYYYVPHIVELTDDETQKYLDISRKIARFASRLNEELGDADLQRHPGLKQALFKRARIIGTAERKLERLQELIRQDPAADHILVYCGDGSVSDEISGNTKRHVDATVELLRTEEGKRARRFTAREDNEERQQLLNQFSTGEIEILVAIRCLDEGVDIPSTQTAYFLASSTNPRQFIQRRGRILRTHPTKEFAVIHDLIVAPPNRDFVDDTSDLFRAERSLIEKELRRVELFAEAARNHPDADVDGIPTSERTLRELKQDYNLRQL